MTSLLKIFSHFSVCIFFALVTEVVLSLLDHGPLVRPDDLLRGDAATAQAVKAAQGEDERGHQEAKEETAGIFYDATH